MLLPMARFHSFLWLNNTWGVFVCVCVCVCVCTYDVFFIHSFVHEHLDCFHILATVNNAAVNNGLHISFKMSDFVSFG